MTGEGEGREAGRLHLDRQFLAQFANQRILRPLAGIEFAAGELPEAFEFLARRALGDEDAIVLVDEGAGDDEQDVHMSLSGRW